MQAWAAVPAVQDWRQRREPEALRYGGQAVERGWYLDLVLKLAEGSVILIFAGFAVVVLWQILVGKINLKGLLNDKVTGDFSPGRLQLLIFTLIGAVDYLSGVRVSSEGDAPVALPDVPDTLLLLVGGSNLVYLGGKSTPGLLRQIARMFPR